MSRSIVITGVGACTSKAENAQELWNQVSGLPHPAFGHPLLTGEGSCFYNPSPIRRGEGVRCAVAFAEAAASEALVDAGLWDGTQVTGVDPELVGCTISASKPLFEANGSVQAPDVVNDALCAHLGIEGERRNVIAACATGAYAVALGASWIDQGLCDVVLAGSVEPRVHPLIEAGFQKMGVVSSDPSMRPFDLHRSGFVLGEGAGIVVLESRSHAEQRHAEIKAVLSGWGWGCDTHSAVAFNSNGARIADVIRQALRRAHLPPEKIQHVNAHGTATRLNDWIETQALIKAFGGHAERLMISGTKSATGHLLGAAGSVELVLTIQALNAQYVPPTQHLQERDETCPLDYTPQHGHAAHVEHALSLSFGFGGPIGALIVSHA